MCVLRGGHLQISANAVQCATVHCCTLQCAAVSSRVLQSVAERCRALQGMGLHRKWQRLVPEPRTDRFDIAIVAVCCSVLQCVAVCVAVC